MSKSIEKECLWCGQPFQARRSTAKYCCESHRISAYNKRKGITVTKVPPHNVEDPKGMTGVPANQESREEETKRWIREVIQEEMKTSLTTVLQDFGIGTAASASGVALYQKVNNEDNKLVRNIDLNSAFRNIKRDLNNIDRRLARIENPGNAGRDPIDISLM